MVPLFTLLTTFVILRFGLSKEPRRAARVALALMFTLTASAHFFRPASLSAMLPPQVPAPLAIIYLTGLIELCFAALLLLRANVTLGWVIAIFLILSLPANVYSAVARVGMGGHGPLYLLFRVPFQALLIGWAMWSCRR